MIQEKLISVSSTTDNFPSGMKTDKKSTDEIAGMKIQAPCCSQLLHFSIPTSDMKGSMIKHFRCLPLFSLGNLSKFSGKL